MNEIKRETDWYPHIERFLEPRKIKILQNEVEFFEQLKDVDLFGFDTKYYYVIEVKLNNIAKDDYYNLKYIIENNALDKPIRGLLFGKCSDLDLYNKIINDPNIELISFKDIPYNEEVLKKRIKERLNYYNEECKFYRKVFKYITDDNLKHVKTGANYINLIYDIDSYRGETLIFKGNGTNKEMNYKKMDGCLFSKKFNYEINENVTSTPTYKENYKIIRNKVYKMRLYRLLDSIAVDNSIFSITEIYESFYILLKYINLETMINNMKNNKFIINEYRKEVGVEFILLSEYWKSAVWCNTKYSYMFDIYIHEKHNKFNLKHSNCKEYNKINFLESTSIMLEDKLYVPIKRIYYGEDKSIIELSIELTKNNKIEIFKEKYTVFTFKSVTDIDFYLICNLDIILDFEDKILEKIKNNKYKLIYDEERNYIYNKLRKNLMKKLQSVKTIKQWIKEFEDKYDRILD